MGGGGADRNSPGDHPPKLTGLVGGADGDAAELTHRGQVLSCGNQREQVQTAHRVDGLGGAGVQLPALSPSFLGRSPVQVLTSIPCPGPDELPRMAWPSRLASLGTASGWKSVFKGDFLQLFSFLLIS